MTNIQAAILKGQIESLPTVIEKKKNIFDRYRKNLNGFVDFQKIEENTKHSNWMFGVKTDKDVSKLSLELYKQGIETRPMFPTMNHHKHLIEFDNNDKNSNILYKNCLILPSHPNLQKGQIDYICKIIKSNI
jgi:dTDP-4-amino-4,6-dideoxygalactose transaminase